MRVNVTGTAIAAVAMTCVAVPSRAADDASVKKDLFTVITLQGMPCGEVVNITTKSDNDRVATCKDGNRYHVFLNDQGRVVVEKL